MGIQMAAELVIWIRRPYRENMAAEGVYQHRVPSPGPAWDSPFTFVAARPYCRGIASSMTNGRESSDTTSNGSPRSTRPATRRSATAAQPATYTMRGVPFFVRSSRPGQTCRNVSPPRISLRRRRRPPNVERGTRPRQSGHPADGRCPADAKTICAAHCRTPRCRYGQLRQDVLRSGWASDPARHR